MVFPRDSEDTQERKESMPEFRWEPGVPGAQGPNMGYQRTCLKRSKLKWYLSMLAKYTRINLGKFFRTGNFGDIG